jgi:hypothetical protein
VLVVRTEPLLPAVARLPVHFPPPEVLPALLPVGREDGDAELDGFARLRVRVDVVRIT